MHRFSFIIPVYNCIQYLEECVKSVLSQTISDFEILLIDDGSTDGSGEFCDSLMEQDSRVRVFHKKNEGAGSARNMGIDRAVGEYILFIDGDDTIEPDCLETIDPMLADKKSLPVFGMSFDYWKDGVIAKTEQFGTAFPGISELSEVAEKLPEFFEDNVLSSACNKVFPAVLLRKNNIKFAESIALYEDLEFVLRCLLFFERINVADKSLYHYRHQLGNDHINARIADLDKVRTDMAFLNRAFWGFGRIAGNMDIVDSVSANLYIAMLEWSLLIHPLRLGSMRELLSRYVSEEGFRSALKRGAKLDPDKKKLVAMIDEGRYFTIHSCYAAKRQKLAAKRAVKRILGR